MNKSKTDLPEAHAAYVEAQTAFAESEAALGTLLEELVGKNVAISGYPTKATVENPGTRKSPKPFRSTVHLRRRLIESVAEHGLYHFANTEVLHAEHDGLTVAANKNSDADQQRRHVVAYYIPIDSVVSIQEIPITES